MSGNNGRHCSFCGKESDDVHFLIAGPMVFICDQCILICLDILTDAHKRFADELENKTKELVKMYPEKQLEGELKDE